MVVYENVGFYLETKKSISDKITALDTIIDSLITAQINAVEKSTIQEYLLNDGQVQVKSIYRDPKSISDAIERYQTIRDRLVNRYNKTSRIRLVDRKNFR